jgi:shikimate kinase
MEVDAGIREELDMKNMDALAAWLGLPGSDGYPERERHYLTLEERYTTAPLSALANVVLDTTGSVVHLPQNVRQNLKEKYLVVHLDVGDESIQMLIDRYFATPKPVIWGEYFSRRPEETVRSALVRSYPQLLHERLKRFRELAHVSVPVGSFDSGKPDALLQSIRAALV